MGSMGANFSMGKSMIKKILISILLSLFVVFSAYAWIMSPITSGNMCLYDDSFHAINTTYWTETDDNTELSVASGELNFNSSGTAQSAGDILSKWTFDSNESFDIRVDFNGISWTAGDNSSYFNQVAIEIGGGGIWLGFGRSITDGDVEQYYYIGSTSSYTGINNTATSGRLRIVYNGATGRATLYYWDTAQARWEWNDSTDGVSPAEDFTDEAVDVKLWFVRRAAAGGNTYNADMDNFRVINGCENITLP